MAYVAQKNSATSTRKEKVVTKGVGGGQPRKALQMLDSQKRAREQAEKAEKASKKAREQVDGDDAASGVKLKSRGEPEGKKKGGDEDGGESAAAGGAEQEQEQEQAVRAEQPVHRAESAFPSRHALASKEDEKEEPAPEPNSKSKKKGKRGDTFGFEDLDAPSGAGKGSSMQSLVLGMDQVGRSPNQTPYGDFGGRKVFIGGTADKDEAELHRHFAQAFGPVSDVEVVRERDGSHRGFAFVTFHDKKHADMLKKQHHTNIGNVRMEAKPCVPPRNELDSDKRIASTLTGAMGQLSVNAAPPPPAVSAWGSGPPTAIKAGAFGMPGMGGFPGPGGGGPDLSWEPLPPSSARATQQQLQPDMSNLGDMFDPMGGGGGFGSMDQMGGGGGASRSALPPLSSAGDLLDPMSGFGAGGASANGASNMFSASAADSSGGEASSSSNWEPVDVPHRALMPQPAPLNPNAASRNPSVAAPVAAPSALALTNGNPCGAQKTRLCVSALRPRACVQVPSD